MNGKITSPTSIEYSPFRKLLPLLLDTVVVVAVATTPDGGRLPLPLLLLLLSGEAEPAFRSIALRNASLDLLLVRHTLPEHYRGP